MEIMPSIFIRYILLNFSTDKFLPACNDSDKLFKYPHRPNKRISRKCKFSKSISHA